MLSTSQIKLQFFFFFKIVLGCTLQHVGSLFPDQGSNPCPALGAWSPNHLSTRKAPKLQFSLSLLGDVSLSPERTKCLALTSLLPLLSAVRSLLPGQLRALHWAVLGLELEEKYRDGGKSLLLSQHDSASLRGCLPVNTFTSRLALSP